MLGQPAPNSITITATRTTNIQPDQVLIGLSVQSPTTAGLDDITSALTGAGISGEAFSGVSARNIDATTNPQAVFFGWSFTLTAPLAKLSATLSQLVSAQQTISAKNSGLTLTVAVVGSPVSPQPCKQADLLADAQAQAKQVASAAGVSSGPNLSIGSVGSLHSPHQVWCPQGMHLRTLAL